MFAVTDTESLNRWANCNSTNPHPWQQDRPAWCC